MRHSPCASIFALLIALPAAGASPPPAAPPAAAALAALEARAHGRLGVAALDTGSGRRIDHRGTEPFPMCSTFKVLLCARVLQRVDHGEERLDRPITFTEADLPEYAPVVRAHLDAGGLSVGALCAATVEVSDNAAANLLLKSIGGPAAVTAFARSLGDERTRLDRVEPDLNSALPGDPRDTTTPDAMLEDLRLLLLGGGLPSSSARQLEAWMAGATTGAGRLRAGVPASWTVAHKTGTGERGTTNDVALLRAPGRAPILVAAYLTGSDLPAAEREAVLAEAARIVVGAFPPAPPHTEDRARGR
ncbi:MAG: class A beta-lactamase [Anaeromyxobacter sp.]